MAISDNTRGNEQRRIEELCPNMQNAWIEFQQSIKNQFEEQQEKQDRINANLNELITGLSRQVLQIATTTESGGSNFNNGNLSFSRLSKVDFPRFDGVDVQGWVYRCEQFFEVEGTPDSLKVKVASIQLTGKALIWHQSFMKGRNGIWPGWDEYKRAMTARFGLQPFDDSVTGYADSIVNRSNVDPTG